MFTRAFKNLSKSDVSIAGGKGASLGSMMRYGAPVPPGFVVLAETFEEFLKKTDLNVEIETILKRINQGDLNSIDKTSNQIRNLILNENISDDLAKEIYKEFYKLKSKYVAVRSSATAEDSSVVSWAGELESYLDTTKNNLLENIKKCWASLFTPRAIYYRFENKLNSTKISVAVIIQRMIRSEVSGICFTAHPVTEDDNQMVIEAGYGFGEAIVSGKITPDTYIVDKKRGIILDKNINRQVVMIARSNGHTIEKRILLKKQQKQKLSDKKIIELSKICIDLENRYKQPQDIEWCLEKNKIYVVQSRPITTL